MISMPIKVSRPREDLIMNATKKEHMRQFDVTFWIYWSQVYLMRCTWIFCKWVLKVALIEVFMTEADDGGLLIWEGLTIT